jgi:2-dehydro-3-deoxyphosphogluconate aldolase/(4S)-4-hydroxy-2-oxoglutarate aldolase
MTSAPNTWITGPRIIPVLTVASVSMAGPLAEALATAGLTTVEVTLRTPAAHDVLNAMAAHGGLQVGAGTVLNAEQAESAVQAGASFVVSPGLQDTVIARCRELAVPVIPGIATASELMRAIEAGVSTVKLFPAELLGGIDMVRALAAVFPDVRFVPTGGIGFHHVREYLSHPAVLAIGGSWMIPPDVLASGNYPRIQQLASQALFRSQHE